MNPSAEDTARVFHEYVGTTHDGPGMRLTFFLQGCPLRCRWCQNPEGIGLESPLWWDERKCIGCGACLVRCPLGALKAGEGGIHPDTSLCRRCGACAEACPSKALQFAGGEQPLEALVKQAVSMREWVKAFGGGVTVSGGEPLCQAEWVKKLFIRLHEEGLHTALDTCALAPWPAMEAVLAHTDCLLLDIKLMDEAQHRQWTGQSNGLILANAQKAFALAARTGLEIWIRTPLIPGATATEHNLQSIGRFLAPYESVIARWELCAFNGLCRDKYQKLGQEWAFAQTPPMNASFARLLRQASGAAGFPLDKVILTGILHEENGGNGHG